MTHKKKQKITIISLALGICMFCGAAFANYTASGGYDVYKKALLGTLYADNYTAEVTMDLMMDGQLLGTEKVYEEFSAEGDANLYRKVETSSNMEEGNSYSQETYFQDKTEIRIYQDPEDENINVLDNGKYYEPGSSRYFVGGFDVQNETDRKVVRFVELLADTFMGDLKNNFVYISGDADSKQYELALDGMQIPEFVNAGLSAIFSSSYQYYDPQELQEFYQTKDIHSITDPMVLLGADPVVRSASTVVTVDSAGRLLNNDLQAELVGTDDQGGKHTLLLEISIDVGKYGTTVPKKIDLNGREIDYMASRDWKAEKEAGEVTTAELAGSDSSVTIELE